MPLGIAGKHVLRATDRTTIHEQETFTLLPSNQFVFLGKPTAPSRLVH